MGEDYGWQQTPLMRKFHYFIAGDLPHYQESLCRKWGISTIGLEPDANPPKHHDEECVKCVQRWDRGGF